MRNVVQVEFFLVNVKASSLNKMLSEIAERRADGSPIKLCVRFFDMDGSLTKLVEDAECLAKKRQQNLESFMTSKGLRRWWFNRQSRGLGEEKRSLRARTQELALKRLEEVIKTNERLAVEGHRHLYRWVRPDEEQEILETARQAKSVWLFAAQTEALLSKKLENVSSLM